MTETIAGRRRRIVTAVANLTRRLDVQREDIEATRIGAVHTRLNEIAATFLPQVMQCTVACIERLPDGDMDNPVCVFTVNPDGTITFNDNRNHRMVIPMLAHLIYGRHAAVDICDWLGMNTGMVWKNTDQFYEPERMFGCSMTECVYADANSAKQALEVRHGSAKGTALAAWRAHSRNVICALQRTLHATADYSQEKTTDALVVTFDAAERSLTMTIGVPWHRELHLTYVDDPAAINANFLIGFYFDENIRTTILGQIQAAFPGVIMTETREMVFDFTWK